MRSSNQQSEQSPARLANHNVATVSQITCPRKKSAGSCENTLFLFKEKLLSGYLDY